MNGDVINLGAHAYESCLSPDKGHETVATTDVDSASWSSTEDVGYTSLASAFAMDMVSGQGGNCLTAHNGYQSSYLRSPGLCPVDASQVFSPQRQSPYGDAPALPRPRSPKRRTRTAPAPITVEDYSSSAPPKESAPPVTAIAITKFGTQPTVAPKKISMWDQQESSGTEVTAVRCSQFGTAPAPTRAAAQMWPPRQRSPKRRMREAALAATETAMGQTPAQCEQRSPSPKKRAGELTLSSAKKEGLPLKIRLPDDLCVELPRSLNPTLPAKKRPAFPDVAGSEPVMALRKMAPDMPVKKCVPQFVFEEPPTFTPQLVFEEPPTFKAAPPPFKAPFGLRFSV